MFQQTENLLFHPDNEHTISKNENQRQDSLEKTTTKRNIMKKLYLYHNIQARKIDQIPPKNIKVKGKAKWTRQALSFYLRQHIMYMC
jgi:hypothetical protein